MRVYLLLKHPPHPFKSGAHIEAGIVVGVYGNKKQATDVANENNQRTSSLYLWTVQSKQVKG